MSQRNKNKIMRFTLVSLTVVILAIVCVMPGHDAQAALTKTTAIVEIDAWQAVVAGTLVTGNAHDISLSFETVLYIEVAPTEAVATTGSEVIVEISYADDNWVQLTTFMSTAETPAVSDVNDATSTAGDAYLILTDSATGDFDVPGRRWFVKDGTIGNSESVRTQSNANPDTVTLCQDTLRNHVDTTVVIDRCDNWPVSIPIGAAYVRTLVYNSDADCDAAFTTRVSKVTALN